MLDEWEKLCLGTGIVMCRRITTDRMSDSSGVHGGHGALGAGEQVQVHANVPGGRRNMAPLIPGNPLPQHDASPLDLSGHLTEVDLSDGGMDLWHGWHGSSSLYRYPLVKPRWLQWLE